MRIALQVEDRLILSCIKIQPTPKELELTNDLIPQIQNWDYLIKTSIGSGIAPLLYKKLPLLSNSSQIPESIQKKLQQAYYKTFSRSVILYDYFQKVATAFTSLGISVIALKGIYLSEYLYKDIGLRQFSDIDLLVKEEDAIRCIAILSDLGYNPFEFKLSKFVLSRFDLVHHLPMIKNGVSIKIHIKLHKKTESYDLKVAELWKNAIPVTLCGTNVSTLNTNDLLIHLCLHLDKHFRNGHVQFTCFNDITNILEKYSETIDWAEFTKACRLYNCENIVYLYIVMVHKFMSATVPTDIIQKYSYLFTPKEEQLFCNYLKGNPYPTIILSSHFGNLKNTQKLSDKVKYLWSILFPSKAFMMEAYRVKRPWLVMCYYPYRYYIGLRGLVNHVFYNSKNK